MNIFLLLGLLIAIFLACAFAGPGKSTPMVRREFEYHGSE